MIEVELYLYGSLRKYAPDREIGEGMVMHLKKKSTINDLLSLLMIPSKEIKIILVNGRHKELDEIISENDRIAIFPAIAGG
jgi:molybdopterin converting factor small subunit